MHSRSCEFFIDQAKIGVVWDAFPALERIPFVPRNIAHECPSSRGRCARYIVLVKNLFDEPHRVEIG